MPVTLEVECPFDENESTFTLTARVIMPNGEEWAHIFGKWEMMAESESFGRFEYSRFILEDVVNPDNRLQIGCDPNKAVAVLRRHYEQKIRNFVRRIARRYHCRVRFSWGEIHFYRLKPRGEIRAEG